MKDLNRIVIGGGEMGELMRSLDWSTTPVGNVENWPQSLKTSVSIILATSYPMCIAWGREYIGFYNDAYRQILGTTKHPTALGQPLKDTYAEIWNLTQPWFDQVMDTGEAVWRENQLFPLYRNGFLEDCFFNFSYSAIRDESGEIAGVLVACTETTGQIIRERRLQTLRELATCSAEAKTLEEACVQLMTVLKNNPTDLPFASLYLEAATGKTISLADSTQPHFHVSKPTETAIQALWLELVQTGQTRLLEKEELAFYFDALNTPDTLLEVNAALMLPIAKPGQTQPTGLLLVGISPHLAFSDEYKSFLELVNGQVATVIANVRAYEEEKRRATALAELDRAKIVFFNNISHEFRTPLTLMIGPLENLLTSQKDQFLPEQLDELQLAYRNSLRLLKLVNTLLEFSRLEAGRVEANFEPTDLAEYTTQLAGVFRSAIEHAGVRLVVDCPSLDEPVYVDREMWEKIILNLLSNAFKFTFEGEIEVSLRQVGRQVELTVSDTGIGIATENLERIFARFQQVQNAQARTYEGSGIGLSLVQGLVHLHGGSIKVLSTPDEGTTFVITVPLGKAHLPPDKIESRRNLFSTGVGASPYVQEALHWFPEKTTRIKNNFSPELQTSTSNSKPYILVVDDNADMRAYLIRLLSEYYSVEAVEDGATALLRVQERQPDLIVADVLMPKMDGFTLVGELRSTKATRLIPIILLSARAGEEAIIEGMESGADDYVIKPFAARELLARVSTNLKLSYLREELLESEKKARIEIENAHERMLRLFSEAPFFTCILRGPTHIFEYANSLFLQIIGNKDILGKPMREALPEPAYEPLYQLIDIVYNTGISYIGKETLVHKIFRRAGGVPEDSYLDFIYQATRDANGQIDGILVHGVDVTDEVVARKRADFMARASTVLNASLDYESTLNMVAELVVPELADWCIVDILEESGEIQRVAVAQADACKVEVAQELKAVVPDPAKRHPVTQVLQSGEALIQPDIKAFPKEQMLGHPDYQAIADKMELRSRIIVPMAVSGKIIGTISLIFSTSDRYYDERHLGFALELAERAALAVDNARLYREAQKAIETQKELDSLKDLFLSIASHELRTPLTTIKGYTQVLERSLRKQAMTSPTGQERRVGQDRFVQVVATMRNQADRMQKLIDQLLDYSRLQTQKLELLFQPGISLMTLINRVVEQQRMATRGERVIRVEPVEGDIIGSWDEARLEQVITNLLTNALKYSPPDQEVSIRVKSYSGNSDYSISPPGFGYERSKPWVLISVKDKGQGIKAEHQAHLFDRYYRVRTKENTGIEGLGLGLYISQEIVKQHGGQLLVESEPGKGSTFSVFLPLEPESENNAG